MRLYGRGMPLRPLAYAKQPHTARYGKRGASVQWLLTSEQRDDMDEMVHHAAAVWAAALQDDLGRRLQQHLDESGMKLLPALRSAVEAGRLRSRPGRDADADARAHYQRIQEWQYGGRVVRSDDVGTLLVLFPGFSPVPTPGHVRDVLAAVRTQVLRHRNQVRNNPQRPALHPDLNIIQYEPGAAGPSAANAAERRSGTTSDMDNPLGLTDDELAWLKEQAGEPPWGWETGIDADDLLLAAAERLWDSGPDYLRSDRVARVDRDRNVRVNVRRSDHDRPVVLGRATPFSYYCTVTVPVDWPESVLASGWAEIDGHFVIEVLSRDESDRPATVRVLEIADEGNDQVDGDGIRMPFGVQYVGAIATVDHTGPAPALTHIDKEPGGYPDLLPMDPSTWGSDG